MAPIRKGDGTGFTPKGFAGVRKGDGTILYSAEPAIPDSVVNRWPIEEGSGQTLSDVVGSADISLNFENWVANSDWIGGYAMSFDGVDDKGDADIAPPSGSLTILITVKFPTQPSDNVGIIGWESGFGAGMRYLRAEGGTDPNFQALVVNDSGTLTGTRTNTLSAGTRYRVGVRLNADNPSFSVILNGNVSGQSLSGSYQSTDTQFGLAYNRVDGNNNAEVVVDEPLICNTSLTDDEIQTDYERQPWS